MEWWEAIVLGFIQGVTEFLPISSSAHVRVLGPLLPSGGDPGAAFTAVIQIGTEAAVLVYFWKDIVRIVREWFASLAGRHGTHWRQRLGSESPDARMGWYVILGSVPIVVLGLLFKDHIETSLRNLWITATVLALFALVLGWADRIGIKKRELDQVRPRDAAILGLAQAMALIPGVSRSGGTISAGLFLGLTREAAARFSFLLAIPAVLGSGVFELASEWDELTAAHGPGLAATGIAALTAFVVGFAVIVWFLRLLKHGSYLPFVIYRVGFAGVIVALLATGVVSAT